MALKVLVVEDEPMVRGLIADILVKAGYQVRTANSAADANAEIDSFKPDVYLMDIELGKGATGFDVAHVAMIKNPKAKFVFISNIPEPRIMGKDNRIIPQNSAYLHKNNVMDSNHILNAVEAVVSGRNVSNYRDDKKYKNEFTKVTRLQLEVLHSIALGMSNQEIAAQRGTSIRAVENLINRACEAAEISNEEGGNLRVLAARKFIKVAGLPEPE